MDEVNSRDEEFVDNSSTPLPDQPPAPLSPPVETPLQKMSRELSESPESPLALKAREGLLKLFELIEDGTESVTNIRVAALQNEVERREEDESEKVALEKYIADKELGALQMYKKIDEKWGYIQNLKDPLNIHNETVAQRDKCEELLKWKDEVIDYLKECLKRRDECLLTAIARQGDEIDLLVDRTEQQVTTLKEAYIHQLEALEDIIDEEKNLMIDCNREKWERMIQERDELDKNYLEKLYHVIDFHEKTMLNLEKEQNELRKTTRLSLEKSINDLTLQNDSLKAMCDLNLEKITYNYQLLLKKQEDNKVIKQHCKNQYSKLGTQLSHLNEAIKDGREKNTDLIRQYSFKLDKLNAAISLTKQRHAALVQSNAKKYFDLWDFNEREAQTLLKKILLVDKLLHEEVLNVDWEPPCDPEPLIEKPKSFVAATTLFEGTLTMLLTVLMQYKPWPPSGGFYSKSPWIFLYFDPLELKQMNKTVNKEKREISAKAAVPEVLLKVTLDGLKTTFNFLLTEDAKTDALCIPNRDQYLIELENILKSLGIESEESSCGLVEKLAPWIKCSECERLQAHSEDVEFNLVASYLMECVEDNHDIFLNPLDVSKILSDFTAELFSKSKCGESERSDLISESPIHLINSKEIITYWESFTKVFTPQQIRFWETMAFSVQQYQKALHKRHILSNEVKKLERSNYEMRRLLQRFIKNSPTLK